MIAPKIPPKVPPGPVHGAGYGYGVNHPEYHPDGIGRPGYFECDGDRLIRLERPGAQFQQWNREKQAWEITPDDMHIYEAAHRLYEPEIAEWWREQGVTGEIVDFDKLAKERDNVQK